MERLIRHAPKGSWPAAAARDSVTLDFDRRHRRRIKLTTDRGRELLLELEKAVAMADGDGLELAGGGWLMVIAAAEPLVEITAPAPGRLVRIAWHLGNRHLPMGYLGDRLLIRPDHVIEDMVAGLGGRVRHLHAPFQPEGGAYADPHHHDHDHGHDHSH
jgi:urease accessory protein